MDDYNRQESRREDVDKTHLRRLILEHGIDWVVEEILNTHTIEPRDLLFIVKEIVSLSNYEKDKIEKSLGWKM